MLTQLATARAGLVLVCINPAYRLHELDYALNKAGCRALVTATAFKTSNYAAMLMELLPELQHAPRARCRRRGCHRCAASSRSATHSLPGSLPFDDLMARGGEPSARG